MDKPQRLQNEDRLPENSLGNNRGDCDMPITIGIGIPREQSLQIGLK